MTDDECPHSPYLTPATCSICKHGPSRPEKAPTIEATFRASYEGECPGCDFPIAPGQVVHRLSNGRYVHDGCQP